MSRIPKSDMKMNAIRSGIVVLGAIAFGYLSIQIGFKPYLEKAKADQQQQQHQNQLQKSDSDSELEPSSSFKETISFPERSS
ncbi:hypothetical protein TSUD_380960 [Trifolium subterraneum]|uniref:Uncharacterized protein n=1 Tax=Trifolium subterraneum TaxID=3900 RepID=A0A2Z6NB50_TRISU|nr:hypothetical protein TSUD_380960 [Trifolium subterraneum]